VLVSLATLSACTGKDQPGASGSSAPVVHSSSPTPTVTLPPPKPPPPPPGNACYRLAYADALAPTNDKSSSPCSHPHTAVTFHVGSYRKSLRVDGAAVHRLESTVCPRLLNAYVGGTLEDRRLSMIRTVWFTPNVDQAAKGAHWFVCVAIALQGAQHLAPLHGTLRGALDSSASRDHYALCGSAEPGTPGFEQRICAGAHTWKALRTVTFKPGPYPGESNVRSAGQQLCQDAGHNASSDPLNYRWSYQWPTRAQWRAGQTYGVCWAPS
jgi:hypothetical protein